jgi:hypothetical protein
VVVLAVTPALSLAAPSATLVVGGGDPIDLPITIDGKQNFITPDEGSESRVIVGPNNAWVFSIQASGNEDPFIAFGLMAMNSTGSPLTFSFTYTTPIVLPDPDTIVFSSLSGGLVDATGNGVSITPTVGANVMRSEVDGGVSTGTDLGPAAAFGNGIPFTFTYGPYNSGLIAGPSGPLTILTVRVDFELSNNGNIAVLTGLTNISAAGPQALPEPATLAMAGSAGLLAVGYGWRRHRLRPSA